MTNKRICLFFLLPILLSLALHFRVFKLDVMGYHVWRQSQTQTVIYNFNFSDNSIFHPQKLDVSNGSTELLYEFPLYQWLVAQINFATDYSVANSRLVSFIIFVFFLAGFYKLSRKFVSAEVALISNTLLCFSPLLYYYCVNPLPDLFALCLSVWSLKVFYDYTERGKQIQFVLFAALLMLAALVKLPYILFGSAYAFLFYKGIRAKSYTKTVQTLFVFLLCLVPVFMWYLKAIPTWSNNPVTSGIFANTKSFLYLLDCFQFNLFSSVPELLTNYASCVFLILGIYTFYRTRKNVGEQQTYLLVIFVCFAAYFLFELNAIEKVHDYYLMPFVPLIFLVVTKGVKFFYDRKHFKFIFFILLLVPITAWLRINHRWNEKKPGFVVDYLEQQDTIKEIIPANAVCVVDYDESKFISLYYLKRKGYSLERDQINEALLTELVYKGASYLITENPSFSIKSYNQFTFEEVFRKNLTIYKIGLK